MKDTNSNRKNKSVLSSPDDIEFDRNKSKRHSFTFKRTSRYVIAISAVGLFIIFFAFFWEARVNRATNGSADMPLPAISPIQAEINSLSWIEQDFLPINRFSRPGTLLEEINGIVIHNIGNPGTTALQNRNYFANLAITGERQASSNFIVCLDGHIIQCVPIDEIAYASNDRNSDTISIEVCHPDATGKFTDESYAATVRLTAWLCIRYGLTSQEVIRHHDVWPATDCPRYFVNDEAAWVRFRSDVQSVIDNS